MDQPQAAADPASGSAIASQLLVIFLLTLLNAFFSASEMALVSVDSNRLKEKADQGNEKAKKILSLLAEPSHFLSMIQICITLAGFFNSASAATGLAVQLGHALGRLGLPRSLAVARALITILLSVFTIIYGELVPKRLALRDPEAFAMRAIPFLWFFSKLLKPMVTLLSAATNGSLKLIGVELDNSMEEKVTLSDIQAVIRSGESEGLLNMDEGEMIAAIINSGDRTAEEIMTPRTEVFAIDISDPLSEYLDELLSARYSRIPVYEDEIDNIIGLLYIKDYMRAAYQHGFEGVDLRQILHQPYFVPEIKNVSQLFNEMREDNTHFAVLIDEYGGFSGIVTMEDIVEEIIGDIDDEYDDTPDIDQSSDTVWYARGSLSIKELNQALDIELNEDSDNYDTLGGLLFYLMGRIPDDTERPVLVYQGIQFTIEKIESKRIALVRIEYDPEKAGEEAEEDGQEAAEEEEI